MSELRVVLEGPRFALVADRKLDMGRMSDQELMRLGRAAILELKRRGVVRTTNAPTGDYAEHLVARTIGGTLVSNSTKSYDVDSNGTLLQVKCRVLTRPDKMAERQLSPFRSWDFHAAVIVLFTERYELFRMTQVPVDVLQPPTARWVKHVNGWVVYASDQLLDHPEAIDLVPRRPWSEHG